MHGMPVAALWGLESGVTGIRDHQWRQILEIVGPDRLTQARTAWYGLRDVDPGERPHTAKPAFSIGMDQIDRTSVVKTVDDFDAWMRKNDSTHLWISFDCDSLDPILAPGTGTAVRGGLTYREAHLVAELMFEKLHASDCPYKLAGVDIMEVNPLRDSTNMTALITVEWVASLFGKTILGKR
jgi:arginase